MSDAPTLRPGDAPTLAQSSTPLPIRRARERFTPGAMVAGRYRIVALLGRGGMGEVYRAEDIRLDQTVALKFLPPRLESNAEALERFLGEVRLGRQVAHPNVCRLYDLGETEGHHFIAMEYVDGEDLASLLSRIGKLPADKAIDIARDIAAGLSAAHALGIVHRDLKPSNVMIDGRGRARLTDFGLAALTNECASDGRIIGTPAYMAPEQLSGGTVSARSDVYAFGLILYECLTGNAMHGGASGDEILRRRLSDTSSGTMSGVPHIDVEVYRLLRRCVSPDANERPASAQFVLASLPGGDPLAAALAAGETPSPELVAAAENTSSLSIAKAWTLFLAVPLFVFAAAALLGLTSMHRVIKGIRSPDTLSERAADIAASAGYTANADRGSFFVFDYAQLGWMRRNFTGAVDWKPIVNSRLTPLRFVYRQSPASMAAKDWEHRINENDPPLTEPGMTRVTVDHRGRLIELAAVPPAQVVASTAPVDWSRFFTAAELPMARFTPAVSEWSPPVASDARQAWTGVLPGTQWPLRVETASRAGKPVWFAVIGPWRGHSRGTSSLEDFGSALQSALPFVVVLITMILAVRNLRRGRGDRRGAMRIGFIVFAAIVLGRTLRAHHTTDGIAEGQIVTDVIGTALFAGASVILAYLGLEPFVRRSDPHALISWVRFINGRMKDPRVGRDVMIGASAGALAVVVWSLLAVVQPLVGLRTAMPATAALTAMNGLHNTLFFLLENVRNSAMDGVSIAFLFVVFGTLIRKRMLAMLATYLAAVAVMLRVPADTPLMQIAYAMLVAIMILGVYRIGGVLGIFVMAIVGNSITLVPTTLDFSSFHAGRSMLVLLIPVALAAWIRHRAQRTLGAGRSARLRRGHIWKTNFADTPGRREVRFPDVTPPPRPCVIPGDTPLMQIAYAMLVAIMILGVYRIGGVLGIFVMAIVGNSITLVPTTLDFASFHAGRSMLVLLIPVALAAWGFVIALNGRSALGEARA